MGSPRQSGRREPATDVATEPATEVEWLEIQLEALYEHDDRGRLVANHQVDRPPPPAFHLSRSTHGNLWRFSSALDPALDPALVRELSRLAGREAPLDARALRDAWASGRPPPPPERWHAMARLLEDGGVDAEPDWRGPALRFPSTGPSRFAVIGDTAIRPLEPRDGALLEGSSFAWLAREAPQSQPVVVAEVGGAVVGAVWSARGAARAGARAREAGVEVEAGHRGRGLGLALVADWAARVCEAGALPLYSTSWSNRASCALAARLGLVPYGEDGHLG